MAIDAGGMLLKAPDFALATFAAIAMAAIRDLVLAFPVIGFFVMGTAGGIIGWALAVEGGVFDHKPLADQVKFVVRRAIIGGSLGVCLWMIWQSYQYIPVLIGMLLAGFAGAFPIKACNFIWRVLRRWIPRGLPQKGEK